MGAYGANYGANYFSTLVDSTGESIKHPRGQTLELGGISAQNVTTIGAKRG